MDLENELAAATNYHRARLGISEDSEPETLGEILTGKQASLKDRLQDQEYLERLKRKRVENETRQAVVQQLERETAWKTLLTKIGKRHAACTLETFIAETDLQRQAVSVATEFQRDLQTRIDRGSNLLIYGPVGTGKDHLLVSLLRSAVLNHGVSAGWVSGLDLWRDIRDLIGANKREEAFVRYLAKPDVLAVSDPSSEGDALTSFQRGFLQGVIDRRYRFCKSTWITINVADRAEMESTLGVPSVDRLGHDCIAIHFDWESFRRRHHAHH